MGARDDGARLTGDAAQQFAQGVDALVSMQVGELQRVPPPAARLDKRALNLRGVKDEAARTHLRPRKTLRPESISESAELLIPSAWAFNRRRLRGEPLRFLPREITKTNLNRCRPFLEQPLNDDARDKGYRKARQIGLSENSVTEALWFADTHDHTKLFYTFPTNRQMQDFSNTRIAEAIQESQYLAGRIGDIKNVNLKKVGTSFLFLRGAQTERLGEGVDADVAFFDEIDRMPPRVKAAFEESLSSSGWGWVREISTPTVPNHGIDASWGKSKQWEWFVKCQACDSRQTLEWLPNDDFGGRVSVIQKDETHVYACRSCSRELSPEDRMRGEWVARYPAREPSYYQFSQLMAPWITAEKLWQKQEDYPFKQLFYNYALGLPYLGDNILVTEEQILAAQAHQSCRTWQGPKAMGIDWGDKSWIVCVQSLGPDRVGLVHLERIVSADVGEIVHQVAEAYKRLRPDLLVCDAGYGKDRNTILLKKFPDRVFSCFYPNIEKGSKIFEPQWQDESHKVSVDRTTSIKLSLGLFKTRGTVLVAQEVDRAELKTFTKHCTNLVSVKDFDEKTGEIEEWIASTGQDHYGHAWNYACVALAKIAKMPRGEFWDWGKDLLEAKKNGTLPKEVQARSKALVPGLTSIQELLEITAGMGLVRPDKAECYAKTYGYSASVCGNCTLQGSCKNICEASLGEQQPAAGWLLP